MLRRLDFLGAAGDDDLKVSRAEITEIVERWEGR